MPEVELFAAVSEKWDMNINYGARYTSVRIKGVQGDYQKIYRNTIYQGRFLNRLDDDNRAKVCILDRRTAEELMTDKLLGNYISIGDIAFRVIGLCENGERWGGSTMYIPFSTYMMLFEPDRHFDQMALVLNDKADITRRTDNLFERWDASSPFEDKLRCKLSPSMQFDPNDQRALWIWNQADDYNNQQGIMNAIRLFMLIVGLCTLVTGAVGVVNIMLVSVKERTKEFGIRKAIGAPPRTILLTVVGESTLITALFGYIGLFVGIGIMELVNFAMQKSDNELFTNPTVDIPTVVTATMILVVVGVIAGAIPAARAMRIKPIEAMNADK
jgi:putative ABC transport system permease protein